MTKTEKPNDITEQEMVEHYKAAMQAFAPQVKERIQSVLALNGKPDTLPARVELLLSIMADMAADITHTNRLKRAYEKKLASLNMMPKIMYIEIDPNEAGDRVDAVLIGGNEYHCRLVWNVEKACWLYKQDDGSELNFAQFNDMECQGNVPDDGRHIFNVGKHLFMMLDVLNDNRSESVTQLIDDSHHLFGESVN